MRRQPSLIILLALAVALAALANALPLFGLAILAEFLATTFLNRIEQA